ncbi:MAG: hypothetical protein GQ574_25870 [Crocinitomix sp.]|nr:hypothetical protein [Crocinitomix sp.]
MQIVRFIVLIFFGTLFAITLYIYLDRISMPYNSQGRYFDGHVVYKDYAANLYGVISLIFGLLSGGLVWELIKHK